MVGLQFANRRRRGIGALFLAIGLLAAACSDSDTTQDEMPSLADIADAEAPPNHGQMATDFTVMTLDGNGFTLSEHLDEDGRPVFLNMWASWCPPCREEAPLLERTWRAFKDRGLVFVGVDIQDKLEDALAYIAEFDITYPNGPDPLGEISIDYGVSGIPVTFFVSTEGVVVRRWVGAIHESVLLSSIQEIMP